MTTRQKTALFAAAVVILMVCGALFGCATRPQPRADSPPVPPGFVARSARPAVERVDEGRAVAPSTVTADLRWPAVPFVPGYEVFFAPSLTQPFTKVAETGGQTNVTVAGLPWAQGYFNVRVMKRWGEGP